MSWQDKLSPGSYRRTLLDSLPIDTFIDLSRLESFNSKHTSLLVMSRRSTPSVDLSFQSIGELPFGDLQLIACAGVAIGYLLLAPSCKKRVGRNFATLRRNDIEAESQRIFVDGSLTILGNDSVIAAAINSKRWIAP